MNRIELSIRHISFVAAATVSFLIAVLVPAAYFAIAYQYMRGAIDARNELNANVVTDIVKKNPTMWRFEELRLSEMLDRRLDPGIDEERFITDTRGELIAHNGVTVPQPRLSGVHNIYDAGTVVARLTTSRSLVPLLCDTLFLAAGSTVFALLVFYLLRTYPLQTVRKAGLALAESEERHRLLFEQSRDALVVAMPNGAIIAANPAACALFGMTREEFLTAGRDAVMDPADEANRKALAIKNHTGQFNGELNFTRKDGSSFPGDVSVSRFSDSAGVVRSIMRIRDITERRKAEEFLQQAKKAAEAASLAKSQFLANMSHEIRTPMNGIIGVTGMLLETKLDPEQREYAEVLRESGTCLLNLVNDVLDLSKIEARKIDLEHEEFDLEATVAGTIDLLSVEARSKGLQLAAKIDPDVPLLLKGDPGRLRQIITNLVGNAIKFTPHGSVSLHIFKDTEDRGSVTLRSLVRDSGIGIPADKLNAIFEPFTQVDSSTTRKYGGTGLGLTLSRQFAEMMGGTMGVESVEGQGSTFWFTAVLEKRGVGGEPPLAAC
ncbi:PAS domain S-box protein [Geobacter sp. FeAm09]|uniref:hybrid sensor histidine kinase/response regulator n=1 Tax=Geobacter sp. FeAm09 TaxID=2597769 RepID=UPI0011ED6BBA|nr:ATP-binding protein [Geobacter sp. FeAm09]QEM67490.1 PAS domain S-box protein [Geobacter sp. FeAm09]